MLMNGIMSKKTGTIMPGVKYDIKHLYDYNIVQWM